MRNEAIYWDGLVKFCSGSIFLFFQQFEAQNVLFLFLTEYILGAFVMSAFVFSSDNTGCIDCLC